MPVCLECEAELTPPAQPRISEVFECPECLCGLEIVALEPLLIALAPEIEEDWGE
ncbi:lysine biosynthesis protein LysW [Streptomyces sp. NPDC002088]|uniref:lysine biosynthesis protein LysW n=1 Tax=Streptomyces sp. NPDC002088 TaxID=3154665 RepID=UPI003319F2B4